MKVTVIGTGYVGLVTGACLAELGNHVVCLDTDAEKIDLLAAGNLPIYEPGLADVVRRNAAAGRMNFSSDIATAVEHGALQFICVGTPIDQDGSADVRQVLAAAQNIGRHMTDHKIVIDKSTVPVGTADKVRAVIAAELSSRRIEVDFSVVSNPEFLKEGAAVEDFMRPDRIVIGAEDERAVQSMRALYAPFVRNHDRMLVMDIRSAEFTKYAANCMLASRISLMNEFAMLAEKVGADIEAVRRGIGSDPRIGYHFLYAGTGYGGSCFPKDVAALVQSAAEHGRDMRILRAVQEVNRVQKTVLVDKVVARFGPELTGRTFALWGLAFKPDTDDMRDAPSLMVIAELLRRGALVRAYDPVASAQARRAIGMQPGLEIVDSASSALKGSAALLIVTEWKEFRSPDLDAIRNLLIQPLVYDGRNLYDPALMKSAGIEYHCIGRAVQGR